MADNYDQLALKWVREEVNKTLDQARQALEAFSENADDSNQIQFCANCLHQVRGTLTMLEFYGAALFAEEMEALAEAIASGAVKNPPKAQEILMGTILQLPTYLERVQAGRRDLPVVLLPLLNDLRSSRGETLLSESSIFTPNLQGVKMPTRSAPTDAPKDDAEFRDQAKKLRHHYQRGLLGVFRNQEVNESLTRLFKVIERFEAINANQPIGLLWWVGAGFVEAIGENAIYKNAAVHALLSQIDKYIKQMGDEGDSAALQEPPPELLKNLLYYIACAENKTARLDELRDAYQLRDALPSAAEIESERQRMTGTDATAIRTVLHALNEDLAGVKDGLDLYVRSKHKNPQDLMNLMPIMRQIADTLAMLGLAVPRDAVRQQVHALQRVADAGESPSEMHVMDIAGALLFVEANLATVAQNAAQMAAEESHTEAVAAQNEDEVAAEAQFDSARVTLINECRSNLQKCKDAIIDFMASQWDHRLIETVPTQLVEVEGGLHIIGLPEAADMVKVCHQFLAQRVVTVNAVPDTHLLDALADVLTSIEYFLESMQDAGGLGLESVLSAAREPTQTLLAEMDKPLPTASARPSPIAPVIKPNESEVILDAEPEPLAPPTVVAPLTSTAPAAPTFASSIQRPASDTVDDEVIEIFIEEAEEQIEAIKQCLPVWMAKEDDRDSLTTIRRAFHTLKGSGRLVGAKLLGETAWSIENMLNRVLDNTIAPSVAVQNAVREAAEVHMPHLRECFAAQQEPSIRPESLIARAEALAKGETIDAVPPPVLEPLAAPPTVLEAAPVFTDADGHQSFAETDLDRIVDDVPLPLDASDTAPAVAIVELAPAPSVELNDESPSLESPSLEPLSFESVSLELETSTPVVETPMHEQAHRYAEDLVVSSAVPVDPLLAAVDVAVNDPFLASLNENADEPLVTESVHESDFGDLTTSEFAATEDFADLALPDANLDELHPMVEESPALAAEYEAAKQASLAASVASTTDNDDGDSTLLDIFAGEAGAHLDTIDHYLTDAALSPFSPKISDDLIRALHTLKGSAKMADLDAIGDVMLPLEKHARDIQQHDASVAGDMLALLQESSAAVRRALRRFETERHFDFAELPPLAERAQALANQAEHADATRNPEILQLFMSEAMDMLSDIDLNLRSWQLDPTSNNSAPIADLFVLLQQAASAAMVPAFASLAHHGAQLFERAQQHQADETLFALGVQLHDQLFDMLDRLAADQHVHQADELIAQLLRWPPQTTGEEIEVVEQMPLVEEPAFAAETALLVEHDSLPLPEENDALVVSEEPSFTLASVSDSSDINLPNWSAPEVADISSASVSTPTRDFDHDFSSQEFVIAPLPTSLPVYSPDDHPQTLEIDADGEEILQIFMEEADDILSALDEVLEGWSAAPDDKATIASLQRYLHTLKGGARLSDLSELGNLSHEFENLFEAMSDGRIKATPALIRVAQEGRDRLADLVNEVREKRTQTKPSLYWQRLHLALQGHDPYADLAVAAPPSASVMTDVAAPVITPSASENVTLADIPASSTTAPMPTNVLPFAAKERSESPLDKPQDKPQSAQIEYIRVPADRLEGLVNLAGESSIFRGRIEQQMTVVRHNLQEMEQTVARLREQLRQLEAETEAQVQARREVVGETYADFDPLEFDRYTRQQELSRALGESAGDLLNLKESLDNLAADAETLLLQQGRVNSELHDSLIRSRMVPFSSLVPRLKRMVRQIGDELGKGVEISIFAEGEMDRTVLERMVAPIEHMMRNAIDHGIERPEKRAAAGKPQTGRIRIRLTREGNEVIIEIQDDGGGINTAAIRRKAIERGLITESTKLTDHELMLLIFEAGFSTAETVTQISGRGVGMDVVASEIKTLGGRIDIDSEIGKGSRFTVRLPFTVSVNQALMVQIGEDILAIPLANIEGIVRISPYELQTYYDNGELRYEYAGQPYRMRYLGTLLDHNITPRFEGVYKPVPILLLHGTEQPVALHVDELLGSREVVVKTVGSLLSTISGLSGATILGDGRVVLILDLPALLRRADATVQTEVEEAHVEAELPLALVVDDSVTVRKVTGRLLERSGYRVQTAKDGVDAVNVLHDMVPDIMLLDIEMPRMDGFELANIVRHDERLKHVPIIMITSRTGDKHRTRAEEIGVDRYLGKPFNDVELLSTMQELLDSKP